MATAAPTVRVELEDESGGDDLLEALSVRGFGTRAVREGRRIAVEVEAPAGEEGVRNLELVAALETWLEATDRPFVVARMGSNEYTVRAPGSPPPPPRRASEAPEPRSGLGATVIAVAIAAVVLAAVAVWLFVAAALQAV